MLRHRISVSVITLLLCAVAVRAYAARVAEQRPFSDWLSSQGSHKNPNGSPRILGWIQTPNGTTLGVADYSGLQAQWVADHGGPVVNTVITGKVTEMQNSDGTASIVVNEDFTNAWTRAADLNTGATEFGYTPAEAAGNPGLNPAVSSGHMQVKFNIPFSGAPLPDFFDLGLAGTFNSVLLHSTGTGPLRAAFGVTEGTPGQLNIEQNGLLSVPGNGIPADAFTADKVFLQITGAALLSQRVAPVHSDLVMPNSVTPKSTGRSWGQLKAIYRDAAATSPGNSATR